MSKELFLKVGTTAYEVQWKQVHGGLVSGASMAIATKALSKITKARGLEKLLNHIAPYTQVAGDETTIKQATDAAVLAGAIPLADALRFAKSDEQLEKEDGDYMTECLGAYSDILAGCLDFAAMALEPMESTAIAESFPYETIKEVANDFLYFAKLKEKPSTSLEGSGVSQDLTTPTTPTKKDIRVKRKP